VSAHDKLLELGLSVYEIQIVLDEHSHELAEEIRSEKITELPIDADKMLINSVLETVARKIDRTSRGSSG
jgi:hypothetical protein